MRKTNLLALLSVVLIAFGFASCGQSSGYQSVIPAEPVAVVKANVNNLLTKSEILKDNQITGLAKNGINEMPENSRELMRKILEDPANSGIDLEQPAFMVVENIEQVRGFALLAVSDIEKLKELVNALDDESSSLTEKDEYSVLKVNNDNLAAFDENKLIIAFSQGAFDATEYMTPDDNADDKCSELEDFLASGDDMGLYMDYKDILRLAEGANAEAFAGMDMEKFKDLKLICSLNFEAGKAVLKGKMAGNNELIDTYKKFAADPETDLQKFIPNATYAFMQFGAKEWGKAIEENVALTGENNPLEQATAEINKTLKRQGISQEFSWSLLNSLDGGIIFGVSEIDKTSQMPIPQMTLVAECKDDKLFCLIAEIMQKEPGMVKPVADNIYSLSDLYYIGYADDKIFVMPKSIYNECYNGGSLKGLASNLSSNKMADKIGNKNGMIVDAKATVGVIKEMGLARRRSERAMLDLLNKFESSSYTVDTDNCELEWSVFFDDANTNSLKQIKDMAISTAIGEAVN